MSDKKGPFDFTIWTIRKAREKLRIDDTCPICDMDAAIRVLEAAGKVDKDKLVVYLNHEIDWKENDPYGPGSAEQDREIRALLEALPEKEEEK